ncbi:MAG: aspartate kinase [Bacteroidetes bacterium]|nr:MAG: aspartate kinase [Bacteroidota bacterium]
MQVFKFGGASINTVERINNVAQIVQNAARQGPLMVVISAMGKTTNGLEKVVEAFFAHRQEDALRLFEQVKNQHLTLAKYLLVVQYHACLERFADFFTEAEWLLHDKPVREYDYYYDQIVCIGELLSTTLVHHVLLEQKQAAAWLDVRDLFRTDNNFREANLEWATTAAAVEKAVKPLLLQNLTVVTQGFIGATADNESTTLGREGSDFSAAIFANMLDAQSQTIWKDVPSVMNADPRLFTDAVAMPTLSYAEIIEMAYYGAQVIHPKTIKPLFEKRIPLMVKCFLDPQLPGTYIGPAAVKHLPPVFIVKSNQAMLQFSSRNYSFVGEQAVGQLYQLFETLHIRPNLTQNGAISFTAIFDDKPEKLEQLAQAAAAHFDVQLQKGLQLLTIRHYNAEAIARLMEGKTMVLEQKTATTIQAVCLDAGAV